MPRIWEALRRAEDEQAGETVEAPVATGQRRSKGWSVREKLLAVYQAIESSLPDKRSRVIAFVGANPGEGTSTLVREFGRLVSRELAKRVVLLDVEPGLGGHYEQFGVEFEDGLDAVVSGQRQLEDVLQPVHGDRLFLGCLAASGTSASSVAASARFTELVGELRQGFDLVLFDTPPVRNSSTALLILPQSDGVVMVVEAGKTRWQVADSLRQRVESQGKSIVGVILNKRKYYIPRSIYRRL